VISTTAAISFFFKKRRMPVCDFVIDEKQIKRTTAAGELVIPWSAVIAVHRYTSGFLVEKSGGAIPLPYRCFSAQALVAFTAMTGNRVPIPQGDQHCRPD
jgi:hypothetical protein